MYGGAAAAIVLLVTIVMIIVLACVLQQRRGKKAMDKEQTNEYSQVYAGIHNVLSSLGGCYERVSRLMVPTHSL